MKSEMKLITIFYRFSLSLINIHLNSLRENVSLYHVKS